MPRRMMFAALAVLVATGGLFVAVQSSAAKTRGTPPPPGLDHFLCYNATAVAGTKPIFKVPSGVTLLNQFSSTPFKATFGAIDLHCNPALKMVGGAVFQPQSPSWHLMCYAIRGHQVPGTHQVQVTNQFGAAKLKTAQANQFCLPSLKSLKTPPVFTPPGPNEIMPDHLTCYPVKYLGPARFRPPGPVQVEDQFSPAAPVAVTIGNPTELCLPTQKMVKGVVKAPIAHPDAHLLCFQVSQTPVISPIWDRNQFGTGELGITITSTLCLPSFKTLIQ
jgi:hypothetical protein